MPIVDVLAPAVFANPSLAHGALRSLRDLRLPSVEVVALDTGSPVQVSDIAFWCVSESFTLHHKLFPRPPSAAWTYSDWPSESGKAAHLTRLNLHIGEVADTIGDDVPWADSCRSCEGGRSGSIHAGMCV